MQPYVYIMHTNTCGTLYMLHIRPVSLNTKSDIYMYRCVLCVHDGVMGCVGTYMYMYMYIYLMEVA